MSISAPINMETFQNTIYDWFVDATDLFTIWQDQSAPRPEYPYGSLLITSGPRLASPQWEQRYATISGQPAGEEVKITTCNLCYFDISCQAHVKRCDSRDPNANAIWYINKAQGALGLISVQTILRTADIAYIRSSEVQNIDELISDAYVSRANIDVTFGAVLSIDEYTGYIEKAHITSLPLGIDQEFGG